MAQQGHTDTLRSSKCREKFVAGNSVRRCLPAKEEAEQMLAEPEPPDMEASRLRWLSKFSLRLGGGKDVD
jgi:hypothetical protein